MTAQDIADKLPLDEEQKASLVEAIELIYREGYNKAQSNAIAAFDEVWLADEEFEPDYEYHRKNFIKALDK